VPSKNSIKVYVKDGFYHIYNRGVEKRIIFKDVQDYKVFLNYLKEYLSPPADTKILLTDFTLQGLTFKGVARRPKNYSTEIELLAYCLMPNHIHFLVKQNNKDSIKRFMHSLSTRYSMYFNKKYVRVGPLFQGKYKASLITEDSYLLHLSRYIHLNPLEYTKNLVKAYSSYSDFLALRKTKWLRPDFILSFFNKETAPIFKKINSYRNFVEAYTQDSKEILGNLTLEDES